MSIFQRIKKTMHSLEHYTHQLQMIAAIIVASIILTIAFFVSPRPTIVDPSRTPVASTGAVAASALDRTRPL